MVIHVNIGEAKTRLSQLIAAAKRGEKVIIDRDGEPMVRLVAIVQMRTGMIALLAARHFLVAFVASSVTLTGPSRHLPRKSWTGSRVLNFELAARYSCSDMAGGRGKLPKKIRHFIGDFRGDLYVSVVSAWEYGQKRAKFPDTLPLSFDQILLDEYVRLDFPFDLYRYAEQLPPIRRDPFDRILVAQAIEWNLTLVTSDSNICRYPVRSFW